ncbi:MAG: TRAP transporter small permease [Sphaerochaeta sp.]|nr:TRAP transporter small permease [Sphaerochaeta sp.]
MQTSREARFSRWLVANHLVPDTVHCTGKERFPEWLRVINHWAHKIMLYVAEIALAMMVAIVFMTVILRYFFNTGIGWAEEVPRLLVTLFAFLACAIGVRDHIHISVNVIYNLCGPKGKWWFDKFSDSAILFCGLYMLLYGGARMIKMAGLPGTLPMTGWPVWIQYLPVPLAGFLITFDSILFLSGVLKKDDLLYSEQETDYVALVKEQKNQEAST